MNRVLPCLFAALLLACSADTSDSAPQDQSEDLRSTSFDLRQPFSGARMETLRKTLATIDDEGSFVRNYHRSAGVHFQSHAPLTDAQRAKLVSSAYSWWTHFEDPSANEHVRDLAAQPDVGKALDAIGLEVDVHDARSDAARASLEKTLGAVAATHGVTIYTAVLPKEDMDWHDLLAIVDEERQEILFETGGFGN